MCRESRQETQTFFMNKLSNLNRVTPVRSQIFYFILPKNYI
jgi:hypothetical protein